MKNNDEAKSRTTDEPVMPTGVSSATEKRTSRLAHRVEATTISRLIGLTKSFDRTPVLRGIDLSFPRGKIFVVLGPSGCGKSVMLKHIPGLLKPDTGEVWFENVRVDQLSESRLAPIRREIGFLFQQSALFDSMNVAENVGFPLREQTAMKSAQIQERVEEVLRLVGLVEARQKWPADLSGGQRKRIALARAIVLKPKLILYDEPTTGLDPIRADVINELILKLKRELHISSIVVTHDIASAYKIADEMAMLYDGKVVMHGSPDDFRHADNPLVQRFMRGEATDEELAGIVDRSERSAH
jgi:phospholipid/cholesterol/gamma-HCH transport system ATP-binding protein